MSKNIDYDAKDLLIKTLARLDGEENIKEFLNDLFSSAEVKDLSRRLLAAKLLYNGDTYQEISRLMGMSAGTICKFHFKTRGSKVLKDLLSD